MLSFMEVPGLSGVKSVSCGPNHMLAIVKDNQKRRVFSWGRNFCGQLGHGSKEDALYPKEIRSAKEFNFKKV
jgi:alpha-tubulin suppressor-like RCC1 family protein